MSRIDNFLMKPISGIIKNKVDVAAPFKSVIGLPFTLHNFATGNFTTRRSSFISMTSGIRYHKSRIMKY